MKYADLRDFMTQLEARGELRRVRVEVDPNLEMTEICDRTLRAGGPAILFERPRGHTIPVLGNLFGTTTRVALGMGQESPQALREIGALLAFLKVMHMAPKVRKSAPCQVASPVHLPGGAANAARLLATVGLANAYGRRGVRTNGVNPGPTLTGRVEDGLAAAARATGATLEELKARGEAKIPRGRYASADEVARLVLSLASDAASYITGAIVPVDRAANPVL